eukprot:647595-Prorocentrum_lima.AAC.1
MLPGTCSIVVGLTCCTQNIGGDQQHLRESSLLAYCCCIPGGTAGVNCYGVGKPQWRTDTSSGHWQCSADGK